MFFDTQKVFSVLQFDAYILWQGCFLFKSNELGPRPKLV